MAEAGIGIAALSVDEPGRAEAVRRGYGLPFPLLCDPEAQMVRAWGLFDPGEKGGIARPASFVLNAGLTVRFRSLDGVATRVRAADLARALAAAPDAGPLDGPRSRAIVPRIGEMLRTALPALKLSLAARRRPGP